MDSNKTRKIITVTGKTGRGKSHLTKEYLVKNFAKKMPVLVADAMHEYNDGWRFGSVKKFIDHTKSNGLENAVYSVKITSDMEAKKLFAISNNLFDLDGMAVEHCLVVEEASKYCSPYHIDENLYSIVSYGRHKGINVILSAQRFAQINKIMTSQSDLFITFQQTEVNDLNQIKSYTNEIDKIKNLQKREFLVFGDVEKSSNFKEGKILELKNNKIISK